MLFEVDSPDSVAFGLQPLDHMAADKASGAIHKDSFHAVLLYSGRYPGYREGYSNRLLKNSTYPKA